MHSHDRTILLAVAASLFVADITAKPTAGRVPAELVGKVVGVHDGDTLAEQYGASEKSIRRDIRTIQRAGFRLQLKIERNGRKAYRRK